MDSESLAISRFLSYVLRHAPWEYELEIDEQGWVVVSEVLDAMRRERTDWSNVTEDVLQRVIAASDKQRHEIRDSMIRAIYGHSLSIRLEQTVGMPPEWLFHGTSPTVLTDIQRIGLQAMARQYVHLSTDVETATAVGRRKSNTPIILKIAARQAERGGVAFYVGNDKVWLADSVPPQFIETLPVDS